MSLAIDESRFLFFSKCVSVRSREACLSSSLLTSKVFHFSKKYLLKLLFLVCGILGLLLHDQSVDCAAEIAEGLSLLQHRGQDAAGIVTCGPKGRFYQCKANGMVRDVFDANSIGKLVGGMGVGHGMLTSNCLLISTKFLFRVQFVILQLEVSTTLRHNLSTSIHHMESSSLM